MDGIVLVHGGYHTSTCWHRLLPLLSTPAVAVDLPGRGNRPADPATVTLDHCVDAVLDEAAKAGFNRFALVGHSLGGLTITETAVRHPSLVSSLVYVGALVPAPGTTVRQLLVGDAGLNDVDGAVPVLRDDHARALFGNDFDDEQWRSWTAALVPEPVGLFDASISAIPLTVPRVYVGMTNDAPVPPALAAQMMRNLGEGAEFHQIDAGHSVMHSQPAALAAIINAALAP